MQDIEIDEIQEESFNIIGNKLLQNIKKRFFGNVKYDKYTFPFYFKSKKLIEDFLKYFDYFYVNEGEYWDGRCVNCLMLKMHGFFIIFIC